MTTLQLLLRQNYISQIVTKLDKLISDIFCIFFYKIQFMTKLLKKSFGKNKLTPPTDEIYSGQPFAIAQCFRKTINPLNFHEHLDLFVIFLKYINLNFMYPS